VRVGNDLGCDFVHRAGRREAGSEVDVLAHATFRDVADRTLQERPVLQRGEACFRRDGQGLLRGLAVGRRMVVPA
jgi:hypothetical protein